MRAQFSKGSSAIFPVTVQNSQELLYAIAAALKNKKIEILFKLKKQQPRACNKEALSVGKVEFTHFHISQACFGGKGQTQKGKVFI